MQMKVLCRPASCLLALPGLAFAPAMAAHAQQQEPVPVSAAPPGGADDSELAMKVANPISDLISVPLQSNYDCCYGPEDADRYTLNVQPVIPLRLSKDVRLITRTIIPFISQGESVAGEGGVTGFGDITQSFFFSPANPPKGLILGAGPAFLWPIARQLIPVEPSPAQ